ncbi:MAG: VCBS repeat-containing protein [Chloroherpetonaceae bacterium]|nr:VCBS repeat-containing protein [Chloroherpetonaceae bacterium]
MFTGCQETVRKNACGVHFPLRLRPRATLLHPREFSLPWSTLFSVLVALLPGCTPRLDSARLRMASATGYFRDVTREVGLQFRYDNDATPQRRFIETTGGGCAFLDYDNDGYLDIFAVQGGPAPGSPHRARPPRALYRNIAGQRFEDVTARVGLAVDTGYGQGVAAADYDNDGRSDCLMSGPAEPLTLFRALWPVDRHPSGRDPFQSRWCGRRGSGDRRRPDTGTVRPERVQLPCAQRPASPVRARGTSESGTCGSVLARRHTSDLLESESRAVLLDPGRWSV